MGSFGAVRGLRASGNRGKPHSEALQRAPPASSPISPLSATNMLPPGRKPHPGRRPMTLTIRVAIAALSIASIAPAICWGR